MVPCPRTDALSRSFRRKADNGGPPLDYGKAPMTDQGVWREQFSLPATLRAPGLARQRVHAACDGMGSEETEVALILTSELVTNAVRHPRPVRQPAMRPKIMVRVHRSHQVLRVEVFDHDPTPLAATSTPRELSDSGWGLYLLDQLASAWGSSPSTSDGGKFVWFEIRPPGSA